MMTDNTTDQPATKRAHLQRALAIMRGAAKESGLSPEEAMEIALQEVAAARSERHLRAAESSLTMGPCPDTRNTTEST